MLLDHGLYFDLDTALRINYSKWWLALIAPATERIVEDRKKYAKLVGNIDEDLVRSVSFSPSHALLTVLTSPQYAVFEAALTGRAALEGSWEDLQGSSEGKSYSRGRSMIDLSAQTEEEMEAIRKAVVQKEGLLLSVFDVLRRVPRRVLMVLKLNELTRFVPFSTDRRDLLTGGAYRSLDRALATTHANVGRSLGNGCRLRDNTDIDAACDK